VPLLNRRIIYHEVIPDRELVSLTADGHDCSSLQAAQTSLKSGGNALQISSIKGETGDIWYVANTHSVKIIM